MQTRLRLFAASMVLSLPLIASPAFSAGDGGGGGNTGNSCTNGKVWDQKTSKCVPQQSGIDDDTLYEYGRDLALVGRYDEAIKVLSLAADKSDPRILNYLGYAHRKSGRVLVGLGYYQEALRNDPDYTLVREYLGEAHLQLGDVASARAELGEIGKRCGTNCEEYVELAAQIDAFVKG
jgi:tetratricopeptide (TPR) repeat protein